MTLTTPWIYSALYNGFYMAIGCVAILLIGLLLMNTPAKIYLLPYNG